LGREIDQLPDCSSGIDVRPRPDTAKRRRNAIALLAVLALCLQLVVPAIGSTASLILAAGHHGGHHATPGHAGHGAPKPTAPGPEHGSHLGLCCIIGGGKLGTGFAPPPTAQTIPPAPVRAATIVLTLDGADPAVATRPVLPVGARAPPRFA
jgi:hypothetical protein